MSSSSSSSPLAIKIIYGSQTGNSQSAAFTLQSRLLSDLSSSSGTSGQGKGQVDVTVENCDDWLSDTSTDGGGLYIVITSSYGNGQAPLGCRLLRQYLDALRIGRGVEEDNTTCQGMNFMMLGLGSRDYRTWFKNPRTVCEGLVGLGGNLVPTPSCESVDGSSSGLESAKCKGVGVADATGGGGKRQEEVVEDWIKHVVSKGVPEFLEGWSGGRWDEGRFKRRAREVLGEEIGGEEGGVEEGKGVGMWRYVLVPILLAVLAGGIAWKGSA
ncbi:hypothetical protein TrCOL_g11655 [Triparma columacea]|uniref:Flavodoxin-like domain-containing protein n=1 Tax=Triparma columacea TaxID=722753 RepID=A0A9W7GAM4_9STRA|nr:hypothetical protein TrCOL_g11655 [Triparma columacea]